MSNVQAPRRPGTRPPVARPAKRKKPRSRRKSWIVISGSLFLLAVTTWSAVAIYVSLMPPSQGSLATNMSTATPPDHAAAGTTDLAVSAEQIRVKADQVGQIGQFSLQWSATDAGMPGSACTVTCLLGTASNGVEVQALGGTSTDPNANLVEVQVPVGAGTASTDGALEIEQLANLFNGQAGMEGVTNEIAKLIQGGQLASTADEFVVGPVRYSVQSGQGAGLGGENDVILFGVTERACNCAPWSPN